ncbi:GDSL-type esterase/lipase family protein [Aquibacillus salsiterrae]|uniref:GDSL-type esterase/lipase family protein n=1 Tax=Aquibacillus salsiterrae TaxID=2950439 RepID=A0A9X3WH85_9BACI|nr:GDSL-type esterase/lipase family protein [Aquibacillus salsiterrae]MDC3418563.1 GDSL-type esterase/lipase family protein [Aquibacillus salsiterrae]
MKHLFKLMVVVLVMSLSFTGTVFAKSEQAKKSLVALGDSIPFGYNLENNNNRTSRDAYPYLIGEEADFRVRDLGKPGWTTEQLLDAVTTGDTFRDALKHADYVTISVGSNDLLAVLRKVGTVDVATLQNEVENATQNIVTNIIATIGEIRKLTDAPLVVYNIYNPFGEGDALNSYAPVLLDNEQGVNAAFASLPIMLGKFGVSGVTIADANTAFTDSGEYVIKGDIHPTVDGQELLAQIGLYAFGF